MKPSSHSSRGSALIITLFFVVLITVIAVAFSTNSRLERSLAHSHFERMRAGKFAAEGVERVTATLERETNYRYQALEPTTNTKITRFRNYVSQPGAIVVPAPPGSKGSGSGGSSDTTTQNTLTQVIPLSSGIPGTSSYSDQVLQAPSLNIKTFANSVTPTHLITDRPNATTNQPPELKLKWVYQRLVKDPAKASDPKARILQDDTSENPVIDPARPLVGRFAYWTDEESTKINYNLAWKKSPTTSRTENNVTTMAHPSQISLLALSGSGLPSFTEPMANAVHDWVNTKTIVDPNRYFNSFEDGRQIDSATSKVLDFNKFELTHYNHDPDTTFFGEDRILLTTNPNLVPRNADGSYARKFLDILREDVLNPDPGDMNNIAGGAAGVPSGSTKYPGASISNKLDMVMKYLVRYLSESNWPIATAGTNFQTKFYGSSPITDAKLGQIAANIVDYVRARESTWPVVQPMRFGLANGEWTLNYSVVGAKATAYQGLSRAPYLTECGILVDSTPVTMPVGSTATPPGWPPLLDANGKPVLDAKGQPVPMPLYRTWLRAEIHLPIRYQIPGGIDLAPDKGDKPPQGPAWGFLFTEVRDNQATSVYYYPALDGTMYPIVGGVDDLFRIRASELVKGINGSGKPGSDTILMPGDYMTLTQVFYRTASPDKYPDPGAMRIAMVHGTYKANGVRFNLTSDYAVVIVPQATSIKVKGGKYPNQTFATMPSAETDDPRVSQAYQDWHNVTTNSFGARNKTWTAGTAKFAGSPQQDVDETGMISDYSLYMPPPLITGSKDPENGRVTSVGELGYIHTGLNDHDGGVNWRTLRLQPNNTSPTTELPDWALIDLFAVPTVDLTDTTTAKKGLTLMNPHGSAVGGRINVNSQVAPFTDLTRDRGLVGVLLGAKDPIPSAFDVSNGKQPPGVPLTLAQAQTIAQNITNHKLATKLANGGFGKTYGYGAAYDSPSEILEIAGVADRGEKSEDLVRQISSLTCARGGVFSIYTIGQALQQTPNGKIIVTGEQRQEAVVERYLVNRGTTTPDDDEIRFRPVYVRDLSP